MLSKNVLYSQVSAFENTRWVFDTSSVETVERSKRDYTGIFSYNGLGNFTPSTLTLQGRTKGSNITIQRDHEEIQFTPEQVLVILRDFNRLQKGIGAREQTISGRDFNTSGGSRLNYRQAPMWGHVGGYQQFVDNLGQYSIIYTGN